ncbi:piggyBac transposable element-derived protein 2-like [Xyrauchen texanus]|uniref:piggyBac transposable element-derived protein 2-like n=1 Tax=Xyrauchen texanus TaxID=154827 RepID=UPI00224292F3|nr:piggyBac transposable element-derived protein 2-like [Xyrauchen texanus]
MNIPFYGRKRSQAVDTVLVVPHDESEDELDGSDEENEEERPINEGESDESDRDAEERDGELEEDEEEQAYIKAKDLNLTWKTGRKSIPPVPQLKISLPQATEVKAPIDYFRNLIEDAIENIVTQSNLYASQCDINKPLNITFKEIERFIGIAQYMAVFNFPKTRLYWSTAARVDCIANTMSVNRWETIKRYLHFSNNENHIPAGQPGHDALFKIRPLLTALKKSFNTVPMHEMLCADEQIVPIIHNFEVYTGTITRAEGKPDIGASGNIVLKLCSVIPTNQSFKLFFDNWFCSIDLQVQLEKMKIHSVGTVRSSRLPNCTFTEDKTMKKKGRGTFEEKETKFEGVNLRAVKWHDNRSVHLLSTYAAAYPTTLVKRWDKKTQKVVEVVRPNIVSIYNKSMGGVDLLDSLIALYRTKVRSKKWYLRLFFHMMDVAMVEAWLLYRRDSTSCGVEQKEQLRLMDFKSEVASCLCKKDTLCRKRGRPSLSVQAGLDLKKRRGATAPLPRPHSAWTA